MNNRFQPKQGGKALKDGVSIFTNGKAFHGWEGVSVQKSIENMSNMFSMTLDNPFQELNATWPLKPGAAVEINIGSERVVTGFIDIMSPSFSSNARTISITGRSKSADLVDSSVTGKLEFTNVNIEQLAKELVAPFKLKVFLSVEPGKPFTKFAIKSGESYFDALDRAARLLGFFWVSTREGNIRLTRKGVARATSELHQDINILSADANYDDSERFQQYIVKGQSAGTDDSSGLNASSPEGTALDSAIKRPRKLVVVAEGSVDTEKATTRAQWEAAIRIARAQTVNVAVQGWRQQDGSLWGINQIVRFKSKFLGINKDVLITETEQVKNTTDGTITNMTLARIDSLDPKPEFKDKDDWLTTLGVGTK